MSRNEARGAGEEDELGTLGLAGAGDLADSLSDLSDDRRHVWWVV